MTTRDRRDLLAPDPVLEWMKNQGIKLTRENYLAIAYMGDDPKLDAEGEANLPKQFRRRVRKSRKSKNA